MAPQPLAGLGVAGGMDLFDLSLTPEESLARIRAELSRSADWPEFAARATQAVPGEGPLGADLLFVGEQPGDEEDLAGRPFVGPAGRLFDRAMAQAGVPRVAAYVTNAVKHFKFTMAGKRRLHQGPDAGEIARYRPILLREIEAIRPRRVVALGASALLALTGRKLPVLKSRGMLLTGLCDAPIFATVHPSYLLRLPDAALQAEEYGRFVADLAAAGAR